MKSKPGENRDIQGIVERNRNLPDSSLIRRMLSEFLKVTVNLLPSCFISSITYSISFFGFVSNLVLPLLMNIFEK